MNNHPIYILTIIRLNGEVIQEESNIAPSIKKSYITNNGFFIIQSHPFCGDPLPVL